MDSLLLHRIKALTKIYSVISLSEISAKLFGFGIGSAAVTAVTGPVGGTRGGISEDETAAVEKKIVHLIRHKQISAKIDQVSGMVRFADEEDSSFATDQSESSPEGEPDAIVRQKLKQSMADISVLAERLRLLQKNVVTSAAYIMKTSSSNAAAGNALPNSP